MNSTRHRRDQTRRSSSPLRTIQLDQRRGGRSTRATAGVCTVVVVDGAYYNLAVGRSLPSSMPSWPNLVVLRTFSKKWAGLAGSLRVGYVCHPGTQPASLEDETSHNVSAVAQELRCTCRDKPICPAVVRPVARSSMSAVTTVVWSHIELLGTNSIRGQLYFLLGTRTRYARTARPLTSRREF